jgi:hypothetical protein
MMLAAFLLAGVVLGGIGCVAASTTADPVLAIRIDGPTTKQATVTDTQSGIANFTGEVYLDKLPVERDVIQLTATADSMWECSVFPNPIITTSTEPHPFNITVIVPQNTLSNAMGHVKLTATTNDDGRFMTTWTCVTVTVAPYFKFSIASEKSYQEILPRQGASFAFKVQNRGNAVDSYEFSIADAKEFNDAGWSVKFNKSTISNVPPNGTIDVFVTARSPQGWNWGLWISRTTPIFLNVTSLGARSNNMTVAGTLPVRVIVRGTNYPLLESITTIIVLFAVGSAMFAVFRRRGKRKMAAAGY